MIGHHLMGVSLMFTGDIEQGRAYLIRRSPFTILPSIGSWQRDLARTPGINCIESVVGFLAPRLSRSRARDAVTH